MHGGNGFLCRCFRTTLIARFGLCSVRLVCPSFASPNLLSMNYPLPTADPPEVARIQALYRTRYQVELSYEEAKRLLEGVMHFIYLTEVEDAIHSLRQEIQ